MINTILVANRGEIAIRIINTAKKMGLTTVAIFSTVDAQAQHVQCADRAFCIGDANNQGSYLDREKIIAIAKENGIDAIHPGYGFLSEDAAFARKCQQAGVCFIGPDAAAICAMGDKSAAKQSMQQVGVPVIPGYQGADQSEATLVKQAEQIGYPLLIKAAAGGGGKGMRTVTKPQDFLEMLKAAKREAQASFDSEAVLLEKYLHPARHIEIQIAADQHGNAVHLFSRDCSIQRRHQKIIEEAPAPQLSRTLLASMAETAVTATKAIQYYGVGTFEFLLDEQQHFYFMEMNTRLQVEHPVTEMITGIDLVEWQIRIANGEALPVSQQKILCRGHAVEARLCAEDPQQQFMPSTGTLQLLQFPATCAETRIDCGVVQGDEILPYYDPLVAKLVAWGETREAAIKKLIQQLQTTYLLGIRHNLGVLNAILQHPDFQQAKLDTEFIKRQQATLTAIPAPNEPILTFASIAELRWRQQQGRELAKQGNDTTSPWLARDAWQTNQKTPSSLCFWYQGVPYHYPASEKGINGFTNPGSLIRHKLTKMRITIADKHYHAAVLHQDEVIHVFYYGRYYCLALQHFTARRKVRDLQQTCVTAPMPGIVVAICVSPKMTVKKNDPLLVMEAMKMQHTLQAPDSGTIKKVHIREGDLLQADNILMEIDYTRRGQAI